MSLENFRNYLVSNGLVIENQLPYFIRWTDGFLQFCIAKNHPSGSPMLEPVVKAFGK
ncbi:MAG: hypothetical protein PVH87_09675 [Desulfobacteraceae bacterium]|jgi:hypothetical protein